MHNCIQILIVKVNLVYHNMYQLPRKCLRDPCLYAVIVIVRSVVALFRSSVEVKPRVIMLYKALIDVGMC